MAGFSLETVLRLDVESFDILMSRYAKAIKAHRKEETWRTFVASQGQGKDVKKFTDAMSAEPDKPEVADRATLQSVFGGKVNG